jgi:hypothetical protein
MKKIIPFIILVSMLAAVIFPQAVFAQGTSGLNWTSAIYYQNTDSTAGTINVDFYEGTTKTSASPIAVNGYASGKLLVGSVGGLSSSFAGSAVLSADVPIAAVYLEWAEGTAENENGRSIYAGFSSSQASTTFYIPTVLKKAFTGDFSTLVGIQNTDSSLSTNVLLEFINAGSTTAAYSYTQSIDPLASHIFSTNDIADVDLPQDFSGSLKITSDNTPVVATARETVDVGVFAYAFEGVSSGAGTVYIPTSLCNWESGGRTFTSYFAIQAIGGDATGINITHYDRDSSATYSDSVGDLTDGSKASRNPCAHASAPNGFIGSAVVTATTGNLVAIIKVNSRDDTSSNTRTAYIGIPTNSTTTYALPMVTFNNDSSAGFRTYIAVQNISGGAATDIVATYYNADGTVAATHTLADGTTPLADKDKINSNPNSAGALDGSGNFDGAVIITSDVAVAVTVRNQITAASPYHQFGEDYTGIPQN